MVDTPSDSPGLRSQDTRTKENGSNGSLWVRLKAVFGANGDASLRESLGEVIDQHEGSSTEISAQERSMLIRLLNFGELRVEDVMVPRADIVSVDETITFVELLKIFSTAGHSRLPVYHETLDDPMGMVHIKDVMNWIAKQGAAGKPRSSAKSKAAKAKPGGLDLGRVDLSNSLQDAKVTRAILFVPPSMSAGDLLVKMQTTRIHMAIVVDEYGGTDGLVSIEDLVEEIVGEIEDEHDAPEGSMIEPDGDDAYIADARAEIEELDALLAEPLVIDERDEDADTLGGLVFSMAGRIPVRGELIRHESGVEFEILDADARRIRKIKVHLNPTRQVTAASSDSDAT